MIVRSEDPIARITSDQRSRIGGSLSISAEIAIAEELRQIGIEPWEHGQLNACSKEATVAEMEAMAQRYGTMNPR